MKSPLEQEIDELRAALCALAERVRLDAVAEAFLRGEHEIREGDYFVLCNGLASRLQHVNSEGRWTYFDGHSTVEPFRIPGPGEYDRLYTVAEVAEIVAKAAPGALQDTADPTDMPAGPARTAALRQMLIDTMSAVEQTCDCERMAAALHAFDARDAELKAPPAPCEHVFADADGRVRYTFCQRGCGTRDPAGPSTSTGVRVG